MRRRVFARLSSALQLHLSEIGPSHLLRSDCLPLSCGKSGAETRAVNHGGRERAWGGGLLHAMLINNEMGNLTASLSSLSPPSLLNGTGFRTADTRYARPHPLQQITPTQVFLWHYYYSFFHIIPPVREHASARLALNSLPPDVGRFAASRCKKSGVSCRDGCQLGGIGPLHAHKRDKWHLRYSGMTDETISCNGNSLFFSPTGPPPPFLPGSFLPHVEIFMLCLNAIWIWRNKLLLCIVSCFCPFVPVPHLASLGSELPTPLQGNIEYLYNIYFRAPTGVYSYQRGCC